MSRYMKVFGWMFGFVGFYALIVFLFINITTNCQSWNPDYWTQDSYCVSPIQIIKGF